VYHKESVSIEQAVNTKVKSIRLITNYDKNFYYSKLYYIDDKLYGRLENSKKNQLSEVRINPESIKEIRLYNKKLSTALTVVVAAGIPIGLITWGLVTWDPDWLGGMSFSK
jgi:hypothetical protein